jgi:lipoprotein-anchoring transpeptidase ErfK/SrfK
MEFWTNYGMKIIGRRRLLMAGIILLMAVTFLVSSCKKEADKTEKPDGDSLNASVVEDSMQTRMVQAAAQQKSDSNTDTPTKKSPRMLKKGDYLLIIKNKHQMEHYRDSELLNTYQVALGKNPADKARVGDNATPEGYYEVNYIKDSSSWTHDFKDGKGEIEGAYGPFFIALYTGAKGSFSGKTWTGIGIHGTHAPSSIGKNASEGCIRLHNEDLLKLKAEIEGRKVQVDIIQDY